jgi:hypothetical protein
VGEQTGVASVLMTTGCIPTLNTLLTQAARRIDDPGGIALGCMVHDTSSAATGCPVGSLTSRSRQRHRR